MFDRNARREVPKLSNLAFFSFACAYPHIFTPFPKCVISLLSYFKDDEEFNEKTFKAYKESESDYGQDYEKEHEWYNPFSLF